MWSKFENIEIELSNIGVVGRLMKGTVSADIKQADD